MLNPLRQKRLLGCEKQKQFSQIIHLDTRSKPKNCFGKTILLITIFYFLSDEHNSNNNRVQGGLKWPHLMNDWMTCRGASTSLVTPIHSISRTKNSDSARKKSDAKINFTCRLSLNSGSPYDKTTIFVFSLNFSWHYSLPFTSFPIIIYACRCRQRPHLGELSVHYLHSLGLNEIP